MDRLNINNLISHLHKSKASVIRDMGIVAAVILSSGFYYCDNYYLKNYMWLVRIGISLFMIITVSFMSFWNGVLRRKSFFGFLLSIFIIPQIGLLLISDSGSQFGWNAFFMLLFQLFGRWPYSSLYLPPLMVAAFVFIVSECLFILGYVMNVKTDEQLKQKNT